MFGAVPLETALTRNGARVGDLIYVTGHLGDAAAAVAVIKQELQVGKAAFNYFMSRYYRPVPRVQEGQLLRGLASAAIDVSDGLMADLGHICKSSGVGAVIDLEKIPVSEALKKLATPDQMVKWSLAGGDDYQLCFTVPTAKQSEINRFIEQEKIPATQIGEVIRGNDVTCMNRGKVIKVEKTGYQHFE
jgi:thiamine-monophosphate kinase